MRARDGNEHAFFIGHCIESEKDDWVEALAKGKDRFVCSIDNLIPFTHRLNNHAEGLKKLA